MFRYLLSVRRVQSQLQHCWALQMQRKHLKSTQTDAVKWRLRNHMAFLIDNLQYYLQVDVYPSHALPKHKPGGGSPGRSHPRRWTCWSLSSRSCSS